MAGPGGINPAPAAGGARNGQAPCFLFAQRSRLGRSVPCAAARPGLLRLADKNKVCASPCPVRPPRYFAAASSRIPHVPALPGGPAAGAAARAGDAAGRRDAPAAGLREEDRSRGGDMGLFLPRRQHCRVRRTSLRDDGQCQADVAIVTRRSRGRSLLPPATACSASNTFVVVTEQSIQARDPAGFARARACDCHLFYRHARLYCVRGGHGGMGFVDPFVQARSVNGFAACE